MLSSQCSRPRTPSAAEQAEQALPSREARWLRWLRWRGGGGAARTARTAAAGYPAEEIKINVIARERVRKLCLPSSPARRTPRPAPPRSQRRERVLQRVWGGWGRSRRSCWCCRCWSRNGSIHTIRISFGGKRMVRRKKGLATATGMVRYICDFLFLAVNISVLTPGRSNAVQGCKLCWGNLPFRRSSASPIRPV